MEPDSDDWPSRAATDSMLVAATLLHLSHASWRPPPPPTKWGRRSRRTRAGAGPPPRMVGGKKVRRRASPMTPLEYGGGTSESGSEAMKGAGISTAAGVGGRVTKVVNAEDGQRSHFRISDSKGIRQASAATKKQVVNAEDGQRSHFRISDSKGIRQASAATKKQTLPKLHSKYRSLLEYRKYLLKELEVRQRVKAVLVSKNIGLKRLQVSLESQKRSTAAAQMPEQVHPKRLQSCNAFIELPDLNIPVIRESD